MRTFLTNKLSGIIHDIERKAGINVKDDMLEVAENLLNSAVDTFVPGLRKYVIKRLEDTGQIMSDNDLQSLKGRLNDVLQSIQEEYNYEYGRQASDIGNSNPGGSAYWQRIAERDSVNKMYSYADKRHKEQLSNLERESDSLSNQINSAVDNRDRRTQSTVGETYRLLKEGKFT